MALSVPSQITGGGVIFVPHVEQHNHRMSHFAPLMLKRRLPLVTKVCQNQMWGISRNSEKRFLLHAVVAAEITDVLEDKVVPENDVAFDKGGLSSPSIEEIQTLLTELCDETSIAELTLRVGSLKLKVKRDTRKSKGVVPAIPPVEAAPVASKPMTDSLPLGSAPPTSKLLKRSALDLAPISSLIKPMSLLGFLEAAADEGLKFVTSPKVGLFRIGKAEKEKAPDPLCEQGQDVKEGEVVCYLEQLGTEQPVEASVSGEVVKILWEDGAPVGYADPLIAIRPSFVGIKKLN